MSTSDTHSPYPLIHVDLNRDPDPNPDPSRDFFFPNRIVDEMIMTEEGERDLYHHEYCSVKWMSSKMRIMKKMTGGGGRLEEDSKCEVVQPAIMEDDSPIVIRVCSDCNTTKTPLWRSGPRGPKSLCNACGIRQRKARRAMALAGAAVNGEPSPYPIPDYTPKADKPQQHKKKKRKKKKKRASFGGNKDDDESDVNPKKKRKRKGKIIVHPPSDPRKVCFEEFMLRLSERISGFQGVFPQDEKEAAILLMALSYGFVQS